MPLVGTNVCLFPFLAHICWFLILIPYFSVSEKKLWAGLKYRNTLGISVSCNILFGEFVTSRPEWLCMDQNMNEGYFSNITVEVVTSISIRVCSDSWE